MVHGHDHHHNRDRRDIWSDIDSWFGFGGDDDDDGPGGQGGRHISTQQPVQPAISTIIVTAEPVTKTLKPEKTSPAGVGPPVQRTRTHTAKPTHSTAKETNTIKSKTRTSTSTSTSTTSTSTSTSTSTKKKKTTSTSHSTSTSSTSTTTARDHHTTTFSTTTSAATALTTTSALTAALDQASPASSPSPSASTAPSSGGLSGGAKAGIAIGVLLGLAALAGVVLFWLHKQKKRRQEEAEEAEAASREKPFTPAPVSQPGRNYNSASTAPTSSFAVPPASSFNSAYGQPAAGAVGASVGAGIAGAAAGGAATNASRGNQGSWSANPNSPSARQDPFTDPENPFDASARSSPPAPLPKDSPTQSSQVRELTPSPTGSISGVPSSLTVGKPPTPPEEAIAAGIAGAAAGGAVVAAAAAAAAAAAGGKKSDENHEQNTPSPEHREGSPENGYNSRPQSPAMGGAPFASNVHRVQMDFTPSLADEMELRAGQLVRILKVYDDGWTQCSTMDGSVQGIAPRSCLSARPLQPRRPPGPGQGPRGGPPFMGPNGRPMSPAGRPPNGGPPRFYQDSRPMTPTQKFPVPPQAPRSMSPGPNDLPRPLTPGGSSRPSSPSGGRVRSNSSSTLNRAAVQPGPSPLAPPTGPLPSTPTQASDQPQPSPIGRKPVPGQQ